MGNGTPPPRVLSNYDYQIIKDGICITSGTYAGCIRTGIRDDYTYHWFEPDGKRWKRNTGAPDANQCAMTEAVWVKCKDGGSYDWNSGGEYWEDNGDDYRWAADAGYDIQLKKI